MMAFTVKKVQQNLALVEYPYLSHHDEHQLNIVANQLINQMGGAVLNVNIFVNNAPIQIHDLGMGEEQFDDGHHGIQEGYHEGMYHEHDHVDPFAELDEHPEYTM